MKAKALRRGWNKATHSLKKRLLRELIEVIRLTPERLEVRYAIDSKITGVLPSNPNKVASENKSEAALFTSKILQFTHSRHPQTGQVGILSSAKNGGSRQDRTADLGVMNATL